MSRKEVKDKLKPPAYHVILLWKTELICVYNQKFDEVGSKEIIKQKRLEEEIVIRSWLSTYGVQAFIQEVISWTVQGSKFGGRWLAWFREKKRDLKVITIATALVSGMC